MKRYIVWIVVTIIYNVSSVLAQPYCHTRTFSNRDGLGANIISAVQQTQDGLMWFATWNGLCCYDGYKFTTFRDDFEQGEILTTNRLFKLKNNHQDDLWCITYDRQVNLFDTHTCKFIDYSKLFMEKYPDTKALSARSIYSLDNDVTWIVGDNGTNFRINDKLKGSTDGIQKVSDMSINKVRLDTQGREWVVTNKGVILWGSKTRLPIAYEHMSEIGKTVILASNSHHLAYYENNRLHQVALPSDVKHIYRMHQKNGLIYLGTDNGLLVYSHASHSIHRISVQHPSQPCNEVRNFYIDSKQRVWVFNGQPGVIMVNLRNKSTEWLQSQATSVLASTTTKIPFFHQDKHGTVWIIPTNGTFSYYDESKHQLTPYPLRSNHYKQESLPYINFYFTDMHGNVWFSGQHDMNVINFRYRRFKHQQLTPGQEVRAVCYDSRGNLWVGCSEGEVMVCDRQGKVLRYLNAQGVLQEGRTTFSYRVYAIYQDSKQRMWIGTKGQGLYLIDKDGMHRFVHDSKDRYSLSSDNIYDIYEDGQGRLWVATYEQGLNLIRENADGKVRFVNPNNELTTYPMAYHKIRRITHTRQGVIILSTSHGMVTFSEQFKRPQDIRFYGNNHVQDDTTTLRSGDVLQTYVTRKGDIYVVTLGGGLQKIKSDNLLQNKIVYSKVELPMSESASSLVSLTEDKQGMLWLVRESSIDRYDPKTGKLYRFNADAESERMEYSEAKPAINKHTGDIALGLMGSYLCFQPSQLRHTATKPNLVFMSVQYQGEMQSHPVLNMDELDVAADKRNFTITFSALEYEGNQLIRYAYQLDGQDWNYVGNAHTVSFNDLSSGHHKLCVRSTNADGEWVDNERVLNIYAHPTFWESPWGYLLYAILLIGVLVVAGYIFNLRTRNKMQKELDEMKTTFFTNIGHKLRTPLTLIGGPVTEVLRSNGLDEQQRDSLEMVQRNSRNMLELVNNMLQYQNVTDNYFVDDENAPVFMAEKENVTEEEHAIHKDIKLLVVEDNADLRSFLVSILQADYEVISATNGKEGLEKALAEMPDFIISDVMMPVMDGLTMIHQIKQDTSVSHIPIIILSAKASLEDKLQGLREGIDDYITKPFSATYLKQRVANIISQRRLLQQNYLQQMEQVTAVPENGQRHGQFQLQSPEIVDNDKEIMNKLMAYLEEHIGDSELNANDLARELGLGRTVFYGKMKSIVGMAPLDFVRHLRMQRAEELVEKSNATFSEIAYSVGFTDPKYFTKCFKKETGMTPSEYRQKANMNNQTEQ